MFRSTDYLEGVNNYSK